MSHKDSQVSADAVASAVKLFAFKLCRARRDAGQLSLRELAARIELSHNRGWGSSSTLQRAFAGNALPSWPVVEALLVDGFGLAPETVRSEWLPQWVAVKDLEDPLDHPFPTEPGGRNADGVVVPLRKLA